MKLRSKLLLGIGFALIITFTLVAGFSYLSLEQSFHMLEDQDVLKNTDSAAGFLNTDIKNAYSISRDYAVWSETYRFVQDQNPGWIDQNMGDDFFTRFNIDYVLVFNRSDQFVYGSGYNFSSRASMPVPPSLVNDTRGLNSAGDNTTVAGTFGIIESTDGLFIVASHPVLKDNFEGPAGGTLQIVRRIDSQYFADLKDRTGFTVTLIPARDVMRNQSLAGAVSRINPASPVAIVIESEDAIAGYRHLDDLQNTGGFYFRQVEPRTIHKAGTSTIFTFLTSLLVAGIFIILFVLLFIDRVILSRLNAIISTVHGKKAAGDPEGGDSDTNEDEVARLALEIDPVFTRLAESRSELKESEERYRTLIDRIPDYVIVHRNGILLYINPAAAARLGYTARELVGRSAFTFIAPEYQDAVRKASIRRMEGADLPPCEAMVVTKYGTLHTVLANGAVITFEGKPASLNVLTDITTLKLAEETIRHINENLEKRVLERTDALRKSNEQLTAEIIARTRAEQEVTRSLQEKDLLLREIHHRVKNNLQIIASLLNLQSRYITDPNVLDAIKGSQSRIRAMALVHERIYRSHNIAEINLRDYLNYLTQQIFQFYNIQQHLISITVTMDDILADIDTITPLGLIINELVSNSLKYAVPKGSKGHISIGCTRQDPDRFRILYHDDGIGMPAGFDWKHTESLGLRLVNSLVDQLNGAIEISEGEGTTFIITIPQKREHLPS